MLLPSKGIGWGAGSFGDGVVLLTVILVLSVLEIFLIVVVEVSRIVVELVLELIAPWDESKRVGPSVVVDKRGVSSDLSGATLADNFSIVDIDAENDPRGKNEVTGEVVAMLLVAEYGYLYSDEDCCDA